MVRSQDSRSKFYKIYPVKISGNLPKLALKYLHLLNFSVTHHYNALRPVKYSEKNSQNQLWIFFSIRKNSLFRLQLWQIIKWISSFKTKIIYKLTVSSSFLHAFFLCSECTMGKVRREKLRNEVKFDKIFFRASNFERRRTRSKASENREKKLTAYHKNYNL